MYLQDLALNHYTIAPLHNIKGLSLGCEVWGVRGAPPTSMWDERGKVNCMWWPKADCEPNIVSATLEAEADWRV